MAFSPGKFALLLVFALLLAVSFASILEDDVEVEDINDDELTQVGRQGEEDDPEDVGNGDPESAGANGPQADFAGPAVPTRVCGVFILCERQGGIFGAPGAKLIQASVGKVFVKTLGDCKTFKVKGKCKGKTEKNHAKLWPVRGEEFDELCFYRERKHACRIGRVQVIKKDSTGRTVEHECTRNFDAHTVQFCMYKDPDKC